MPADCDRLHKKNSVKKKTKSTVQAIDMVGAR